MKQTLTKLKGKTDNFINITGDFHTPLSIVYVKRKKISKDIDDHNNHPDLIDIIYIFKTLYPTTAKCVFCIP